MIYSLLSSPQVVNVLNYLLNQMVLPFHVAFTIVYCSVDVSIYQLPLSTSSILMFQIKDMDLTSPVEPTEVLSMMGAFRSQLRHSTSGSSISKSSLSSNKPGKSDLVLSTSDKLSRH